MASHERRSFGPRGDAPPRGGLALLASGVRDAVARISGGKAANPLSVSIDDCRHWSPDGTIDGLGVGLSLTNASARTIEYEVAFLQVVIEGRRTSQPEQAALRGDLAPGGVVVLDDCITAIGPLSPGKVLQGSCEFTLCYGPRGSARRSLETYYVLTFKAGSAQEIAAFTWYPI